VLGAQDCEIQELGPIAISINRPEKVQVDDVPVDIINISPFAPSQNVAPLRNPWSIGAKPSGEALPRKPMSGRDNSCECAPEITDIKAANLNGLAPADLTVLGVALHASDIHIV
jgi:hypothetical protein